MYQLEAEAKQFVYHFLPSRQHDRDWPRDGWIYPTERSGQVWWWRDTPTTERSKDAYKAGYMPLSPTEKGNYEILDFFGIEEVGDFVGVGIVIRRFAPSTTVQVFKTYWWLKRHEGRLKLWA